MDKSLRLEKWVSNSYLSIYMNGLDQCSQHKSNRLNHHTDTSEVTIEITQHYTRESKQQNRGDKTKEEAQGRQVWVG
jgi:hypothetical protein